MDLYYKQGNFELLHPDISKETLDNLEYKAINEEISRLENKLELDILLVGSKEVVEAYIKWRRLLIGGVYSNSDAFEQMITCINVMRKDLGLEEAELSLQIFDEYAYISEQTYKKRRKEV
jgi:hypothetical protein